MNKEQITQIGNIMENRLSLLIKDHVKDVLVRLDEEIDENEGERTQLTVPFKLLIVADKGEYQIESSMDLVKRVKNTFTVDPVNFNPNQPDFFNDDKPVIPDDGDIPPEADPDDKEEDLK